MDELAPDAKIMGAVNLIHKEGRKLIGGNTDGKGFMQALTGDAGIESLAALSQLEELNLAATMVGDAGLEQLQKLESLKRVNLSATFVSDESVAKLRQALPDCEVAR